MKSTSLPNLATATNNAQPHRSAVLFNLDEAWEDDTLSLPTLDVREWGPRLRYLARPSDVEAFFEQVQPSLGDFILYGSGDFHHLAGLWVRRLTTPVTVVSFDNHPDWDIRPPRWACGGWVSRAVQFPHVNKISVWGCGNFELTYPSYFFANHRALRAGRLEVHAWAERQPASVQRRFDCMTAENWQQRFDAFARSLAGQNVYVTVDLDCIRAAEAITNWENGLFTAADVAWALGRLDEESHVIGGDICGAFSPQVYSRPFQRFAGGWDHPKVPGIDIAEARRINRLTLEAIWPALCRSEVRR